MKKSLKIWCSLIFILFLFPIILQMIPKTTPEEGVVVQTDEGKLVYAANIFETESEVQTDMRALLYNTHSHEAFEPITLEHDGKIAVSHQEVNIMGLSEKVKKQLEVNGVGTDIIDVDVTAEMNKARIPYHKSYDVVRPYVQKALNDTDYDIILDIHRDSLKADRTTATYEGEKFAQVVFVIGGDHANFKLNQELAERLMLEMEQIVPNITKKIVFKSGHGVDGKYNQDLHKRLMLVEIGGIGNDEAELNRTTAVLAKAVSQVLLK
ncbi:MULTISPECIES: stage II sporulation protein P [unclassified Sporosarcina]|uniref:stage II sporulation protein P n=1 Tax=unclassified Sporosarcina TaxID=2647733 RepID=UPI000C166700|nr:MULTISPECIES: stage II sporulation protein P [unclassified Sporosarcina]PID14803.1 stage II sporulation protein P [Sporosarcina sp. P34]PID24854.1 stage II sporulation protein P [Sporosarcina sp. P7]